MSRSPQSGDLAIQMFDPNKSPSSVRGNKAGKKVLIWMSDELRERLDQVCAATYRSLTAEVTLRLEASLENQSIDEHGVIVVHSPVPLK